MTIEVFCDGSYRPLGDSHRVRWGFVVYGSNGTVLHFDAGRSKLSKRDGAIAELHAITRAVEWANERYGSCAVTFFGDNAGIIRAMRGESKLKVNYMRKMHQNLVPLLGKYWQFEWVPREENTVAHRLAQSGRRPLAIY